MKMFSQCFSWLVLIALAWIGGISAKEEGEKPISDEKPDQTSPQSCHACYFGIAALILTIQALTLHKFGQPWICRSGIVKLWHGSISDDQNSQHITDPYTFTHILHGVLFFGILVLLVPHFKIEQRYLIALGIEASWEVLENSPMIIKRYRASALAQGYVGDSIINSLSDALAMSTGFWLTFLLPVWVTIGLTITEEIVLGILIRDNLTLNLINLIHPCGGITKWQSAKNTDTKTKTEAKEKGKEK